MRRWRRTAILWMAGLALAVPDGAGRRAAAQDTDAPRAYNFVRAQRVVVLSAEQAGVITELPFEPQDFVRADQKLVQLDPNLVAIEIENIRMQIEMDTAEQEAIIRQAYARDNYDIIKDLFESQVGSVRVGTVKEMREAEQQRDLMALSVTTARREHKKLQLQLRQMEKRLTQYAIRAPWDGVVVPFSSVKNVPQLENLKMPETGEMVQVGQSLVALMKVDRLRVPWTVPARQLGRLRLGKAVRVYIPNDATDSIPGEVVFISPTVESTGLALIEVELANPTAEPPAGGDYPRGFYRYRFRPGTSARVEIP